MKKIILLTSLLFSLSLKSQYESYRGEWDRAIFNYNYNEPYKIFLTNWEKEIERKIGGIDEYIAIGIDSLEIVNSDLWMDLWFGDYLGDCCTGVDGIGRSYNTFKAYSNVVDSKYPDSNMFDGDYKTAHVISSFDTVFLVHDTALLVDYREHFPEEVESLLAKDTISNTIHFTFTNGYAKSQKTFEENSRVKSMQLYVNNQYQFDINLLDTRYPQRVVINKPYLKGDKIGFVTTELYRGTKYPEDICITEMQYRSL